MDDTRLHELDRRLGPLAVMSLTERGLLPAPFTGGADGDLDTDRVVAALAGAAIGSAMGLPYEWAAAGAVSRSEAVARLLGGPPRPVAADVQLLRRSLRAMLSEGVAAASTLAAKLPAIGLRNPGQATVEASRRIQGGAPWHEAGVGSFGNGALVRSLAAGIAFAADPAMRPLAAALDTVVTHASVDAVTASVACAELLAALLTCATPVDAGSVAAAVAASLPAALAAPIRAGLAASAPLPSAATAIEALAAAIAQANLHGWQLDDAVPATVEAGGDTDTVAALVGALCGAASAAVPSRWLAAVRGHRRLVDVGRAAGRRPGRAQASVQPGDPSEALHISVVLDRSGSMGSIATDIVGGFNSFLSTHRAADEPCRLTLVQFDGQDPFEVLIDAADITSAPDLDPARYQPRATTPLYDAVGELLDRAEARAAARAAAGSAEEDQLVVIITDGLENASVRWDRRVIFRRIEALQARGWAFVFLGADQDAYSESSGIGIGAGNTSGWRRDGQGAALAWSAVGRVSLAHRRKGRDQRFRDRLDVFEGRKEAEAPPSDN